MAYLGSTLAERVKPTVERILATATRPGGDITEVKAAVVVEEFSGEAYRSDVGSFVTGEIEELLWYRELVHCRNQWAKWAKRIGRGVFILLLMEGFLTVSFFTLKVIDRPTKAEVLLSSVVATVLVAGFCISCVGAMNHYYEKISEYRDKVL